MKTVTLVGGSCDGKQIDVQPWLDTIYMAKCDMSLMEVRELAIDDNIQWKWPEDVYERTSPSEFHYVRTVEYKPK